MRTKRNVLSEIISILKKKIVGNLKNNLKRLKKRNAKWTFAA